MILGLLRDISRMAQKDNPDLIGTLGRTKCKVLQGFVGSMKAEQDAGSLTHM